VATRKGTSMTYEYLAVTEQQSMIEAQLLALEREHFNVTMVTTPPAPGAAGSDAMSERITWLEAEITRLRTYRDSLTPPST
jgi:hypothetical protein